MKSNYFFIIIFLSLESGNGLDFARLEQKSSMKKSIDVVHPYCSAIKETDTCDNLDEFPEYYAE